MPSPDPTAEHLASLRRRILNASQVTEGELAGFAELDRAEEAAEAERARLVDELRAQQSIIEAELSRFLREHGREPGEEELVVIFEFAGLDVRRPV